MAQNANLPEAFWIKDLISGLVTIRNLTGISQRDLAKKMGSSQSEICAFENFHRDFKASTVQRYLDAFGVVVRIEVQFPEDFPDIVNQLVGGMTTNDKVEKQ